MELVPRWLFLMFVIIMTVVHNSIHQVEILEDTGTGKPKKHFIKIALGLQNIPQGYADVQVLNLAYNHIKTLPDFCFWNNSFSGVKKLYLFENKISNISKYAFKGLKQVKIIDISDNNLTKIDPYTFKYNVRLQKLVLMNNYVSFDRLQTFILSHSLDTLMLSNNRIDQVYELTFLGVPNLKNLFLNDNDIYGIAPNSFKTLNDLQYLSLANTGVFKLGESMFSQVPRILNLEGTPLAARFDPPLKKVKNESVLNLLRLNQLLIY